MRTVGVRVVACMLAAALVPAAVAAKEPARFYGVGCVIPEDGPLIGKFCDGPYASEQLFILHAAEFVESTDRPVDARDPSTTWGLHLRQGIAALDPLRGFYPLDTDEPLGEAVDQAIEAFSRGERSIRQSGHWTDPEAVSWVRAFLFYRALSEQLSGEKLDEGPALTRRHFEAARALYHELASLDAGPGDWELNLAWVYYRLGDVARAEEIFDLGSSRRPELRGLITRLLAVMLAESGQAERGIDRILGLLEEDPRLYSRRSRVFRTARIVLEIEGSPRIAEVMWALTEHGDNHYQAFEEAVQLLLRNEIDDEWAREQLLYVAAYVLAVEPPPVLTADLERLRNDVQLGAAVRQLLAVYGGVDPSDAEWWLEQEQPIENAPDSITPRTLIGEIAHGSP